MENEREIKVYPNTAPPILAINAKKLRKDNHRVFCFFATEADPNPLRALGVKAAKEIFISYDSAVTLKEAKPGFAPLITVTQGAKDDGVEPQVEEATIGLFNIENLKVMARELIKMKTIPTLKEHDIVLFVLSLLSTNPALASALEIYLTDPDNLVKVNHLTIMKPSPDEPLKYIPNFLYFDKFEGVTKFDKNQVWTDIELRFFIYVALVLKDKSLSDAVPDQAHSIMVLRASPFDAMLRTNITTRVNGEKLPYSGNSFRYLNTWFDKLPKLKTALYHGVIQGQEPEFGNLKTLMEYNQLGLYHMAWNWLISAKTLLHVQREIIPEVKAFMADRETMIVKLGNKPELLPFYKYIFPESNPTAPRKYPNVMRAAYEEYAADNEGFRNRFKLNKDVKISINRFHKLRKMLLPDNVLVDGSMYQFDEEITKFYNANLNIDLGKVAKMGPVDFSKEGGADEDTLVERIAARLGRKVN